MGGADLFRAFDSGKMSVPDGERIFGPLEWKKHPAFEGVELKHIVVAEQTGGAFSFHLVRIAPGKMIGMHTHGTNLETHEVIAGKGMCLNDGTEIPYDAGTVSFFPAGVPHEVRAGEEGLSLFAKFFPALC
ncbi:MAG: cupin domain-containing protein [Synergistales bacterium]|nr:cupin domain-containing protein [Synergistales bacterium]